MFNSCWIILLEENKKVIQMKLFLLILLIYTISGSAKKLYKYQDSKGHWHYTDQKPGDGQKFESRQMKAEPKRHVWLERTGPREASEYVIRNNFYGPVEVEVKIIDWENVNVTPELPKRFVIESNQAREVFKITAVDPLRSWKYGLEYRYTIGTPLHEIQPVSVYYPPLAANSEFHISQAFSGHFSHHDDQNQYAVDIVMPVGTPVHAAREGVVMEVENDYFNSGTHQAYQSRANSIRIVHEDGSMAVYAHLALERAQVYPGMKVRTGQLIAFSGNTGFSTGPHLHFAVQANRGMKLVSIPFRFMSQDGASFVPQQGMSLQGLAGEGRY